MIIAFEGPSKVGKTYGANKLSGGKAISLADEDNYLLSKQAEAEEKGLVHCFDQVGWITHMVEQLTSPGHTSAAVDVPKVFAMPDAHLVFKLYDTDGTPSNTTYAFQAHSLLALNEARDYSLFKTVTILGVSKVDRLTGASSHRVLDFSSPLEPWYGSTRTRLVDDDLSLLDLLMVEDAGR